MTRRTLLAAGGAGAVTLLGGELLLGSTAPRRTTRALSPPVRSMFTPHVGSTFTVRDDAGRPVRMRLVSVEDLHRAARGDENAFGLLLHGSRGLRLEQTVAQFEHPLVRTHPLLVSPAGTGAHGQDYSVTVNRNLPSPAL